MRLLKTRNPVDWWYRGLCLGFGILGLGIIALILASNRLANP